MAHAALPKKPFIQTFLFWNSLALSSQFLTILKLFLRKGRGSKLHLRRWHIPLMFIFWGDWYRLDNGVETNLYVLFRFHFVIFFLCVNLLFSSSFSLVYSFPTSQKNTWSSRSQPHNYSSHFYRLHPYSFSSPNPFGWHLPLPTHLFPLFPVRIAPAAHQQGKVIDSITSRSRFMYILSEECKRWIEVWRKEQGWDCHRFEIQRALPLCFSILILSFGHIVSGKEGMEYCMRLRYQ